jgi:hypothetical protein
MLTFDFFKLHNACRSANDLNDGPRRQLSGYMYVLDHLG